MGDFLIRNISEAMKRDIAEAAQRSGNSLSDEAKELLREALQRKNAAKPETGSAYAAIRAAFEREDAVDDEFVAIMGEIEAARKKDFGRPFEDLE
ncbi:plasmid stabilization protein [Rhizobium sp. S9]|jgi:antitoxin FitA|uniref:Plasmid stabilization protein n=1 Tax=Rhizobium esperanzae TaxID=1967781 RepID=A0A246E3X1_9HYPH|nr:MULTISPECIES: plasmid stabilization protein [Rhizobium]ARO22287.1 ribbon-helix-helix domain-containing protein [Rhizobium sp. TAL182]OWO96875.1 plasmid stabilization protein [Rhizobium esperanzae]PDS95625.1 plasmid stabilization protein [Rhizobium sp. S9]